MKFTFSSAALVLTLVACGNPALKSGDCARTGSDAPKQVMLANDSSAGTLSHLPGGFLVYDEIGLETFVATGDLSKSVTADQKCSALLIPRLREGKAYFEVTSAESCLRPFVWSAVNQRVLLSLPGRNEYQEFKVKDARVLAVPSFFALIAPLPEKVRARAVDASTIDGLGTQGYYTQDYRGWEYNSQEEVSFLAAQCAENNKATPVPENCFWFIGHRHDSIEVELSPENKSTFENLASASLAFEKTSVAILDSAVPGLGKRIEDYNANLSGYAKSYDELLHSIIGLTLLACKDAVEEDPCFGTTLEQRKAFTLSFLKLYRPTWISSYEMAFSSADQLTAKRALRKKTDEAFVEGIKTYFAPAIESYYEFRKEFSRRQDLVSILSNHLEGTKYEPGKVSFRALFPFASKIPEPLKGIQFSFKDGNVLMTHPGAQTNKNLALDGHIGSVFAFGGLPVLGFGPSNIDQSDATSRMPIPGTTARATRESGRNPPSSRPTNASETPRDGGC
jgi:hypothetical protein